MSRKDAVYRAARNLIDAHDRFRKTGCGHTDTLVRLDELRKAIMDIPDFDGMRSDLADEVPGGTTWLGTPPSPVASMDAIMAGLGLQPHLSPAQPPQAATLGQNGTSLNFPPIACNTL